MLHGRWVNINLGDGIASSLFLIDAKGKAEYWNSIRIVR